MAEKKISNSGTQHEVVSPDDLDSLKFLLNELEKAQYAVQLFQRHIANKYRVRNGESVDLANGGMIIRTSEPA